MRKLRRAIARQRMVAEGWTHLNKRQCDADGMSTKSRFADNWKKYYAKAVREAGAK